MNVNERTISAQILRLTEARGGMITTRALREGGLSRALASYLVSRGLLARVGRGVYSLPESPDDRFYSCQCRFGRGIYSHATALYLHGMTDRTPHVLEMTFPASYNTSGAKADGIACHRVSARLHGLSVVEAVTPCGNKVRAYSVERTLCDVFKATRGAPSDEEIKALRAYLRSPSRNTNLLFSLATQLKAANRLRPYLEALI